jgi:DNA-binding CsgD family transcriptional regulator
VTGTTSPGTRADARAAERALRDLLAIERELLEHAYVRRADALERVGDAIRRLGELAVTEGILGRAASELGTASEFHRVLISEVADGRLRPLTIWSADDQPAADAALAPLAGEAVMLEYPLLEHDVARGSGPRLITVAAAGARTPAVLARHLRWSAYGVAALAIGGETIGLLHADAGDRTLDALDAEVLGKFAEGLAGVLERAVLRHTLGLHRAELAAAVQWMGARLGRLTDAAGPDRSGDGGGGGEILEILTPRELDVLRLLARGQTNLAIANALVVREGTVKYHVKNILNKLGATSRADAVARFVRGGGAR